MLFSKLKDLTGINLAKPPKIDFSSIQNNLSNGLFEKVESSFRNRKADKINSSLTSGDVEKLVSMYAKKNMILAAATSIVPGPLGILGSIPELVINMGNQMYMIYDLGCAYDKEDFISKDLLIEIPLSVFGGNTDLSTLQNSSNLLDSPQILLKQKTKDLGKAMVEKSLKKSIVQFVPVAGPLLMGTWAKLTTSKIANSSKSFLDDTKTFSEPIKKEESKEIETKIQVQKIKALANLIESNDDINEEQIAFIAPIIENMDIPKDRKNYLFEEASKMGSNFEIDYDLFKTYGEADNLILEMIVMAKRNGFIDDMEKAYIFKVADHVDVSSNLVLDMLEG